MQLLVILAVALFGVAAAGDDGSYTVRWQPDAPPHYSSPRPAKRPVGGPAPTDAVQKATKEFNRLYKEAAARNAAASDDYETYEPQQYHTAVQPHYSSPRPAKRPVGGPAPSDAVQKATKDFNRLYKEAAARNAAASDDYETYEPQQYHTAVQPHYSSPRPAKRPVGGPAPTDAVQKATAEFNRLYKEAAARNAAASDDYETYEPQQYHTAVQPHYSSPRPAKRPVGGPAPSDAVQKATAEFNRLYKEAAARNAAASDDYETYEPQQYHTAVQPHYSSPRPAKRPVGGPAPSDAVQKATAEFNRLYKEAAARNAAASDDYETYEPQQYHTAVQPHYSSPRPAKRPVGGPAPSDAVQKATKEFNRLYKEAAARTAAASDDYETYEPQQYHTAVQPHYSSPRPAKRPVGGPAPSDAVQKATKEFNRLYKEAATRAAAASDDHFDEDSVYYSEY